MFFHHIKDSELLKVVTKFFYSPKVGVVELFKNTSKRQKAILLLISLGINFVWLGINPFMGLFDSHNGYIFFDSFRKIIWEVIYIYFIYLFGSKLFGIKWRFRDVLFMFLACSVLLFFGIILLYFLLPLSFLSIFLLVPIVLWYFYILGKALSYLGNVKETKIVMLVLLVGFVTYIFSIAFQNTLLTILYNIQPYLIQYK